LYYFIHNTENNIIIIESRVYVYLCIFSSLQKIFRSIVFARYVSLCIASRGQQNASKNWSGSAGHAPDVERRFLDAWRPHEDARSSSGNTCCRLEIWDLRELGLR